MVMDRKLNVSPVTMIVLIALILCIAVGVIAFQAWLLGLVLGWFGVTLAFWQNVVIVLLVGSLVGGVRSSN
jgi:hypothetical protein